MLLLPADMLGEIVTKRKLDQIEPLLPVLVLNMDMIDLPPRQELASATSIYAI